MIGMRRVSEAVHGILWGAVLFGACPTLASASQCRATVLHDVRAVEPSDMGGEAFETSLKKGEDFDGITQYFKDTRTGETALCAHGSSCFPTHVKVDGKRVEALRLENCNPVNPEKSEDEPHMLSYDLELDQWRAARVEKRMEYAEAKLDKIMRYPISANFCQ
jgi:hypothetical protein